MNSEANVGYLKIVHKIKFICNFAGNPLNSTAGKLAPRDCNKVSLLVVKRENLFYEQQSTLISFFCMLF